MAQRGPQRRRVDPVSLPPAARPLSRCPRSHPQARGSPAPSGGNQGHAAGAHLEPPRRPPAPARRPGARGRGRGGSQGGSATLTQTGPSSSSRWPRTLGREVACQAAGALPLWRGTGRPPGLGPPRVLRRRRRRSCASSCSGAPAASSPLRAQGQSPRSLQTPKRESESPGCRRAEAEAGTRARSLARGGCSGSYCCPGLNLPSRSRRRHPVRLGSARALSPAPRRPRGWCAPAGPPLSPRTFGRGAQGGGGGPGAGRGPRLSPPAPSSLGKVYFRSASLCLWFHFLFPDHDSNTIEGNHI